MSKKQQISIDFSNGDAAQGVTGSCIHIYSKDFSILLECGLTQTNSLKNDYYANKRKFNFSPKKLDYVFCMHLHTDHSGKLPLLYKQGCTAPLIVPADSSNILKDMGIDSAHIMERDAKSLSMAIGKEAAALYTEEDVYRTLSYVEEYPMNEIIKLNEYVSFRFTPSGHIICGSQIELWLTCGNTTKKIVYTSDLGNNLIPKNYVGKFEPIQKADLLIGETTYAEKGRKSATAALRARDIEALKSIIQSEVIEGRRRILIPVFALDRLPEMLTELYKIYGHDENFNIPILIDTPLGLKHIKSYFNILKDEQLALLSEVFRWPNIIQVGDYSESVGWATSSKPAIILASSGMLTAGRSLVYAEHMVNDFDATIVFCGYSTEGSIGWKIKHPKQNKYININGKQLHNRCKVLDLHSFSSHMQYEELLKYYSGFSCSIVALVHGEMKNKIEFAATLKEQYEKDNCSTKVCCVNKSTVLKL